MKPLALDFSWQPDRRPMRLALALLAASLLAAARLGAMILEERTALAELGAERERLLRVSPMGAAATLAPEARSRLSAELRAAQGVIERLDTPWSVLFSAIESAFDEHVTLLNVEPDAERRDVRLTAEAKDLRAMLAYVGQLRRSRGLADPYLASHQVNAQDALRPVRFVVVARWVRSGDTPVAEPVTDATVLAVEAEAPFGVAAPAAEEKR